jgi:hypothetical protein
MGKTKTATVPGPQAPVDAWSPEQLSKALKRGSVKAKVDLLKRAGILNSKGKLARKYRSWGKKVVRTPESASP